MRRVLLVLTAVACAAICARAQWEVGGYIGGAHTQTSYLRLSQPALGNSFLFRDVRFRGESFQSPLYYGVRGGYFFTPHWGAQVEFIHLKVFANVERVVPVQGTLNGAPLSTSLPMDSVVQRFSISHGVNLLLTDLVFRQSLLPVPGERLGRLLLNFRLGLGGTVPHPESEIQGHGDEHYQAGSLALQAAAGAEFRLWRGLYWTAEYKYTRTRQQVDVFEGTAATLLESNHLVTGPTFHF